MDFITSTIVSGLVYDCLKKGVQLCSEEIKSSFQGWLIDDVMARKLEAELGKLELSDELSEKAIEKRLQQSQELMAVLNEIPKDTTINITQIHNGTGDIIGRDKICK